MTAYEIYAPILESLEGKYARLIYTNGTGPSGVVTVKDYGHTRDIRIGRHAGFNWPQVIGVEVKVGNRYQSATRETTG